MGTGKARSFVDLMQAIGRAVGREVAIEFVDMPVSIRANYQYFTEATMKKLNGTGNGFSVHSLEDGVSEYVISYLSKSDPYR